MQIDIDGNAGFCFGVTNAIQKAEAEISKNGNLLCLGEMVHNNEETARLSKLGMKTINYDEFSLLNNTTVLLRAHGEPPSTYKIASENNIKIIDATCPIVLRLHKLIRENARLYPNAQTVIYGKKAHAEVIGLNGQVNGKAVIISSLDDINKIDFNKNILLYSQTTMSSFDYDKIAEVISQRLAQSDEKLTFMKFNTGCKSVANRERNISEYACKHDIVLFVAGANSSNGKYLFSTCRNANPNTYYISTVGDLKAEMFSTAQTIGITGATSTPKWLLNDIATAVENYN